MKQSDRRSNYQNKNSNPASSKISTVTSEEWLDGNYSQLVAEKISIATESFKNEKEIEILATSSAIDRNITSDGTFFKYNGELRYCFERINCGEVHTAILAYEEELLIGYGIIKNNDDIREVTIIDVDLYSRRMNDFSKSMILDDRKMSVGVGHAIVMAIVDHCKKPIVVDSTTSSSRFLFKSFGFKNDRSTDNPCILKLE